MILQCLKSAQYFFLNKGPLIVKDSIVTKLNGHRKQIGVGCFALEP